MNEASRQERPLQSVIRVLRAFDRALREALCDRMDRWVISQHAPEDLGDGVPRCVAHRGAEWPCRTVIEVTDRIDARHAKA